MGLLILGLTRIEQDGLTAVSTLALLAAALVLLTVFVLLERRVPHPLVRFSLFRIPGVGATNTVLVAVTAIVASNLFFTTLYVQQVLGFTPVATGMAFLPNSLLVVSGPSPRPTSSHASVPEPS